MSDLAFVKILNEIDWGITLLAAIPLSIAANLLTPVVQTWHSGKSKKKTDERLIKLRRRLEKVKEYKSDSEALYQETLLVILRCILLIGVGGAITSFPYLYIVTGPIGTMAYLIAITTGWSHMQIMAGIRDYERYVSEAEKEVSSLSRKNSERS